MEELQHPKINSSELPSLLSTGFIPSASFSVFGDVNSRKKQELRSITREEVALHDNLEDCWVIINSGVYDVTKYVEDHPGGKFVFKKTAGKDATAGFQRARHSSRALALLSKFHIGHLLGGTTTLNPFCKSNTTNYLSLRPSYSTPVKPKPKDIRNQNEKTPPQQTNGKVKETPVICINSVNIDQQ